jgi:CheY-like chemotaxis protein
VSHHHRRFFFGLLFLLTLVVRAPAAEERGFFGEPKKPIDFWRRAKFEIEVGKYDFAAKYLKGFVAALKKLGPKEANQVLVQIEEKEGMSAFIRLLRIPPLLDNKKDQKELQTLVSDLNKRVSAAVTAELQSPVRIRKYLKNLTKTPEERAWAVNQLRRSKEAVAPYFFAEMERTEGTPAHDKLVTALRALLRGNRTLIPPLLAALDRPDNNLRRDILDLVRDYGKAGDVGPLWHLWADSKLPAHVRIRAGQALATLLETRVERLPAAKIALTKLAERYYRHQVKFSNPQAVKVWKYDPKKKALESPVLTADQAEEYYGLRYAREALDLDPAYRPAQAVFLSLALEKAYGTDVHRTLKARAPKLAELMKTISPSLIAEVLDRSLREHRLPVILGTVQALGEVRNVRAARQTLCGGPVLAKALFYPDRRVQMFAAEAMLRAPGPLPSKAAARIVEISRRALLTDPAPKVLVAYAPETRANFVRDIVKEAGFEAVLVKTRQAALGRLKEAADIDAIVMDHAFPRWQREFPFVLAELRSDVNAGLLPILVTAPGRRVDPLRRFTSRYRNVWVKQVDFEQLATTKVNMNEIRREKEILEKVDRLLAEIQQTVDLSKEGKKAYDETRRSLMDLPNKLLGMGEAQAAVDDLAGQLKKLRDQVGHNKANVALVDQTLAQLDLLKASLKKLAPEKFVVLKVVSQLVRLKTDLKDAIRAAQVRPLSKVERQAFAEIALGWLKRMAQKAVSGFNIRPARDAVFKALHSNKVEMVQDALVIVGRLPGSEAQRELAAFVLDPMRDKLRAVAAQELARHIQANGLYLTNNQIKRLRALYSSTADAKLKTSLGLVISSLQPGAKKTGERLKDYQPAPPKKKKEKE